MAQGDRVLVKPLTPNTLHQAIQTVILLIGSFAVGLAIIMKGQRDIFWMKFQGQVLVGSPGEDLVVVQNFFVSDKVKGIPYHYHCPGPESSPSSLK